MEPLETRLQKRMHVSLYALLFLTGLLGLSVLLEGCTDTCESKSSYVYYEPIYKSFEEIKEETRLTSPQPLSAVGKIYIKGNYLFVNDPGKGIHIFNNTDPASPLQEAFLNIPGNYDLAIKGNTLYADSYIDLVAFDISNVEGIKEVSRESAVFSYFNYDIGFSGSGVDATKGIITGWKETTKTEVKEGDCSFQPVGRVTWYNGGVLAESAADFTRSLASAPGTGSGPGVGGSMARFTVHSDFLYAINSGYLHTFDVTAAKPVSKIKSYVGWDIETIFPYGANLFLGSSSGMHILSLDNPENPAVISTYTHVTSCDPVVVQDGYAYVTLRSGNACAGFTNQLEVIDIHDKTAPSLVKIYPMTNPHGLGVDGDLLFVCDGQDGLKVYKADDVMAIDQNLIKHYESIHAFDVIPHNDRLVMIGEDGLFQYSYADPENITLLSQITIQ